MYGLMTLIAVSWSSFFARRLGFAIATNTAVAIRIHSHYLGKLTPSDVCIKEFLRLGTNLTNHEGHRPTVFSGPIAPFLPAGIFLQHGGCSQQWKSWGLFANLFFLILNEVNRPRHLRS
jgi:hypothetical protein